MHKRREFLKAVGASAAVSLTRSRNALAEVVGVHPPEIRFTSEYAELALSATAPAFVSLNVDGLGKGKRGPDVIGTGGPSGGYRASVSGPRVARQVEYRPLAARADSPPAWTFELSGSRIALTSNWTAAFVPPPVVFHFDLKQVHSTVLGVFRRDKLLAPPALVHFPGQGSLRLTSDLPAVGLTYTSNRPKGYHFHFDETAALSLPAASAEHRRVIYTLEVTAIYPPVRGIDDDSRFDAFRRNWLDILQLNPSFPALANNTASDTCGFTYFEYGDIAALTPPLAQGLTACDLMRQSLDRILAGGKTYGMPGYGAYPSVSADTYPSLMIAAADCVRAGGGRDDGWLDENYAGMRDWAESMLATDTNGNGLIKYSVSGDSGVWKFARNEAPLFRPSNWWDDIGFGYEDAYANALAYRALPDMAMMARRCGRVDDAKRYLRAAGKLRDAYFTRFFDPATGVLGGWRSADGRLHDYYFLWVNGIAIHYGLVERSQANAIMNALMAKMKEVGYHNFSLGLPGNLVPVALRDCADMPGVIRWGCGSRADNADGFQHYENGGATAALAFFTIAALYDLGRKTEADAILFPMLESYGECRFAGTNARGYSADWRQWDGTFGGYEGYLADDYYALLAVPLRQNETAWRNGFRPSTMLT